MIWVRSQSYLFTTCRSAARSPFQGPPPPEKVGKIDRRGRPHSMGGGKSFFHVGGAELDVDHRDGTGCRDRQESLE